MHYTVYKTTNNINGKYYIGVHKAKNIDDSYLGSGVLLKKAIKKYGKHNFRKVVLFIYKTESEMYTKEKDLVTRKLVLSKQCYNLKTGGSGGFSKEQQIKNSIKGNSPTSNIKRKKTYHKNRHQQGIKNSQYRKQKIWINNRHINKLHFNVEDIPVGWFKGRLYNNGNY